jgi:hypothetical protein
MKTNLLILLIGIALVGCKPNNKNDEIEDDKYSSVEVIGFGKFIVPSFMKEHTADTTNGEISLKFGNNLKGNLSQYPDVKSAVLFEVNINSIKGYGYNTISYLKGKIISQYSSESNPIKIDVIKDEKELYESLYSIYDEDKKTVKSYLHLKHFLDLKDSVEVKILYSSLNCNCHDSLYNSFIEDSKTVVGSISYQDLLENYQLE